MTVGTVGSYLVAGLGQGRSHQIQTVAHTVHTHELKECSLEVGVVGCPGSRWGSKKCLLAGWGTEKWLL